MNMYNEQQQALIDALQSSDFADYDATQHQYLFDADNTAIVGFKVRASSQSTTRINSNTQFMDRLYDDELTQIYTKAKTDINVEIFKDRVLAATDGIDLDDPGLRTRLVKLATLITLSASTTDGASRIDELLV